MERSENKESKPSIQIVPRPGGRVVIVGCEDAARYCGVSAQAFGRVIRDRALRMKRERRIFDIERKVREKYPELFEGDAQ